MKIPTMLFLALAVLTTGIDDSRAAVQLSNLDQEYNYAQQIVAEATGLPVGTTYVGQSFTTGDSGGDGWDLASVILSMDFAVPVTIPPFVVAIYSNVSGAPGTVITTLDGDDNPVLNQTYTYDASGPVILQDLTQYWLVASAVNTTQNDGVFYWDVTVGESFDTQAPGWSVNSSQAWAFSEAGSSWDVFSAGDQGGLLKFSIDTTPVPEPSTWALVVLGGVGCIVLARRQAKASA